MITPPLGSKLRIIGFDPGLQKTGWGVIDVIDNRIIHVANGAVKSTSTLDIASRLDELHRGLEETIEVYKPDEAAVEETFVNKNPTAALALGIARGISLLVPAQKSVPVVQYLPNKVKKSVVGAGKASKDQVEMMIRQLLPGVNLFSQDAADALAVAICHAHLRNTSDIWAKGQEANAYAKGQASRSVFNRANTNGRRGQP